MFCFQIEGAQGIAAMAGTVPSLEQRDELDDPLATPDVDKLHRCAAPLTESEGDATLFSQNLRHPFCPGPQTLAPTRFQPEDPPKAPNFKWVNRTGWREACGALRFGVCKGEKKREAATLPTIKLL
ncbi:hypothetical protein M0R45_016411 [Rubus argutus]|uniref:Uncharacterized protein n=1 Tax=Rubus argutus TaxID=59490 RepID=A0AAW1XW53_RUBAR